MSFALQRELAVIKFSVDVQLSCCLTSADLHNHHKIHTDVGLIADSAPKTVSEKLLEVVDSRQQNSRQMDMKL